MYTKTKFSLEIYIYIIIVRFDFQITVNHTEISPLSLIEFSMIFSSLVEQNKICINPN